MERRLPRLVTILALAFLPAACGRSCGCVESEKTYESLDGKVKVSLVRKVKWVGGKVPGPMTRFFLHLETSPPIDHPIACDHVDMAEDEGGKLVAYRCKDKDVGPEWNVLRLRGGDRYLFDCKAPVGTGKEPEWKGLDVLGHAESRILDCIGESGVVTSLEPVDVWSELARSIEEDSGQDGVAGFFSRTAKRPLDGGDSWAAAFAKQSAPVRDKALLGVCPQLEIPSPDLSAYAHAAGHCRLDATTIGDAAVTELATLLARPVIHSIDVGPRDPLSISHRVALQWAAIIAAAKAPAKAGAVACALVDRVGGGSETDLLADPYREAVAVLASTKTKCPLAVQTWLTPPLCNSDLDCNDKLCTEAELAKPYADWTSQMAKVAPRRPVPPPSNERGLLAIAYAQGPLDKELIVRNARRLYAPLADDSVKPCSDETLARGAVCRCTDSSTALAFCNVPAATTTANRGPCELHADDTKKTLSARRAGPATDH